MMWMHMLHKDSPVGRAIGLALFLLPIEYVAEILSVAVHEILGHGLSAVVLGGSFYGFVMNWDGMGQAFCDLPSAAPLMHQVLHLAAGVIAEITCGVVLWGLISFFRRRPDLQLVLLMASSICLIDGTSYVLWNAYHPVPPGDIGRILWLSSPTWPPETSILRWMLLAVGALLLAGTTLYFYTAIFVRIEALILPGGQLAGGSRLLTLLTFLVLPDSVGWFVFDWDQVAPGIGRLPCAVGALSVVVMAGLLFWYRPRLEERNPDCRISWRHVAVSWMCLIATVLALALWFDDGVRWASDEEPSTPRIVGPFAVSGSGEFLFCGVERDRTHHHYMIVSLRDDPPEPLVLSFPGSGKCHGAMWRPGANPEELLFVTAGETQAIKRFRVSRLGVEEISSYPVDANLLVTVQSHWWSPSGEVLALRVAKSEKGVFSGAYVGFSKDNGKTVHVSAIPAPTQLLWIADDALYVTHGVDADKVVVSKAELNADNLTVAAHDVLQDEIILAVQSWRDSLLYAKGDGLFRDGTVFAVLPEKVGCPIVNGDYLAVASADGKRVYILNGTGEIVDARETPGGSVCLGVSAANKSIYWTASSPEDRKRICAYNFVEKRECVIIEARLLQRQ